MEGGGRGGSVRVVGYRGEAAATLRCPLTSTAPYLHSRRPRRAWSARRAASPPLYYRLSTTPQRLAFPPARKPLRLSYTHPGAGRRSTSSSASGSSTSRTTLGACCATLSGSGARTGFRSEALLSSQSFHREQGTACRRAARRRGGAWRLLSDSIV